MKFIHSDTENSYEGKYRTYSYNSYRIIYLYSYLNKNNFENKKGNLESHREERTSYILEVRNLDDFYN